MVTTLSEKQKIGIRIRLSQTPPDDRLAIIGLMRQSPDVPAELVAFFESENAVLIRAEKEREAESRRKSADEIRRIRTEIREPSPEEVRAFWVAVGRVSAGIALVGSGVAFVACVVIPAALAVGQAAVIAAPYVVGGFGAFLLLRIAISSFRRSPSADRSGEPEVIVRTTTITETFRQ